MNITPVQNNSQSFGMAFKLKGDGAKKLAAFLEETNSATNRHVMEDLIKPINALKTEVVYDGRDVLIGQDSVSECLPVAMPGSNNKILRYRLNGGSDVYHIIYDVPQGLVNIYERHPFMQQLFNAKEIAKDMGKISAAQAYKTQQAAEKQARIEETAKKLQDLFG